MDPQEARHRLIALARDEGFALARIAPADVLAAARDAAHERLAAGDLADLAWMTGDWLDRATDPGRFLAGARSILVVGLPYSPTARPPGGDTGAPARGRVAAYAAGRDYHRVFEKRLRRIARRIREELGESARATVDYGPLLERPLAAVSGMGWQGKSTMLLVPGFGPWVLLGAVATSIEAETDKPLRKRCGSCVRCIVACPTGALSPEGNVLDARLCISYHTIENRGAIPRELRAKFGDRVFGCDDCLDACPVGSEHAGGDPAFTPAAPEDAWQALADLLSLDEAAFADRFRGRALMRARRDGLLRNACIALGNGGLERDVPALLAALDDASPLVRGHAAWGASALARRLGGAGVVQRVRDSLEMRFRIEQDAFVQDELAAAIDALPRPQAPEATDGEERDR